VAFILTRVQVGNYEAWKPMFDADSPGVRQTAKSYRLFRSVEDPNEVFVQVEFASAEEARVARGKLEASGVLDRFPDHTGPTVVDVAESVTL
jgi:hypothetical protein